MELFDLKYIHFIYLFFFVKKSSQIHFDKIYLKKTYIIATEKMSCTIHR